MTILPLYWLNSTIKINKVSPLSSATNLNHFRKNMPPLINFDAKNPVEHKDRLHHLHFVLLVPEPVFQFQA